MWLFTVLASPAADDILLLLIFLSFLTLMTLAGYFIHSRKAQVECSIITASVLSLSGLLTGFAFSAVINGYGARVQAQSGEIRAISQAWQFAGLLNEHDQEDARQLLKLYLSDRIRFYQEGTGEGLRTWITLAQSTQQRLWQLTVPAGRPKDCTNNISVLNAFSELSGTLLSTQSVWHRRLPDTAWVVLLLFTGFSGFLTGYRQPQGRRSMAVLLLLPLLTGITLFLMAEIDMPGTGLIHVSADSLEALNEMLQFPPPGAW